MRARREARRSLIRRGRRVPASRGFACPLGRGYSGGPSSPIHPPARSSFGQADAPVTFELQYCHAGRVAGIPPTNPGNLSKMQGKALWYVGPGRAELREEKIAASKPGEV